MSASTAEDTTSLVLAHRLGPLKPITSSHMVVDGQPMEGPCPAPLTSNVSHDAVFSFETKLTTCYRKITTVVPNVMV